VALLQFSGPVPLLPAPLFETHDIGRAEPAIAAMPGDPQPHALLLGQDQPSPEGVRIFFTTLGCANDRPSMTYTTTP
jgi:hypothetical protein